MLPSGTRHLREADPGQQYESEKLREAGDQQKLELGISAGGDGGVLRLSHVRGAEIDHLAEEIVHLGAPLASLATLGWRRVSCEAVDLALQGDFVRVEEFLVSGDSLREQLLSVGSRHERPHLLQFPAHLGEGLHVRIRRFLRVLKGGGEPRVALMHCRVVQIADSAERQLQPGRIPIHDAGDVVLEERAPLPGGDDGGDPGEDENHSRNGQLVQQAQV